MPFDINKIAGREPLVDYPWQSEVDTLLSWLQDKDSDVQSFCFDLVMSAAYIDATSGLEKSIEQCDHINGDYNAHVGFINLCSPCYLNKGVWSYQKAIKPQSGALGKLSSEIILRFIEKLYPDLLEVLVIGGVEFVDAILKHKNGTTILAEVKSAPLLTYPFLFKLPDSCLSGHHEKVVITNSQLRTCDSAIYLHRAGVIELGQVGDTLWPFRPLVQFITDSNHSDTLNQCVADWLEAKQAYTDKDRQNVMYYLANASGQPPKIAKDRDHWPDKESISDNKTSAGMDRTDDIKKGIYQSLKIGTLVKDSSNVKTAIISNLPAYRHGNDYVSPFLPMLWGYEENLEAFHGETVIKKSQLRRAFDYLITLNNPLLRGEL